MTDNQRTGGGDRSRKTVSRVTASWFLYAAFLFVFLFGVGEIATRLMTQITPFGTQSVFGIPLLPYRPDQDTVRSFLHRRYASEAKAHPYSMYSDEIGWTLKANATTPMYTTNSQRVRTDPDRVYGLTPEPGRLRIVAVGDSFTHASEVRLEETWGAFLEASDPKFEVINMGVPSYGTDQAFLRWRLEGRRFRSHVVILGIWPGDICRNLNKNRYLFSPAGPFSPKPRFRLEGSVLVLDPIPESSEDAIVQALSNPRDGDLYADDYWRLAPMHEDKMVYRSRLVRFVLSMRANIARQKMRERLYLDEDPLANDVTVAIAGQFAQEVRAEGARPLVLIFPMREFSELLPDGQTLPLVTKLRAAGIDTLDIQPSVSDVTNEKGKDYYFMPGGHLNAEGNRLVAEKLRAHLSDSQEASR